MILCKNCKGKKPLVNYREENTKGLFGLTRVRCSGCGLPVVGKFWILSPKSLFLRSTHKSVLQEI